RRTFVDVEAVAVGHDLSRGTAAFRRAARAEPLLTERPERVTDGDAQESPKQREHDSAMAAVS
ncbi:single-stranded DNA-binding protein, partial [Streptomyces anulatus]